MLVLPKLEKLEKLILALAPSHYGTPNAPDTEIDLLRWVNENGIARTHVSTWNMPVSNLFCEHTIYSNPAVNVAFRAWHDSLHLLNGIGFDLLGELEVARIHQIIGTKAGLSDVCSKYYGLIRPGKIYIRQNMACFLQTKKLLLLMLCQSA